MGSSLIGGLLTGFTGVALQKQQQKHMEDLEDKRTKLSLLTQIDPSGLDPAGQQTLASMLDDTLGSKGKDAPYQQLFKKVQPLFEHLGKQKQQQGQQGQQVNQQGQSQPNELQQLAPPPAPDDSEPVWNADGTMANPSAALIRKVPTQPSPAQPDAKIAPPPAPQNVAQDASPKASWGTRHPRLKAAGKVVGEAALMAASPMAALAMRQQPQQEEPTSQGGQSIGQLWAAQNNDPIQRRQAQAEAFRKQWVSDHGPLTQEQEQELYEYSLGGAPRSGGFRSRYGAASLKDTVIARNVIGPDNKPADLIEHPDGTREYIPVVPKAGGASGLTAKQKNERQDEDDMMIARGGDYVDPETGLPNEAKRPEARRIMAIQRIRDASEKQLGVQLRNQRTQQGIKLTDEQIARVADELKNNNYTVRNSRLLLSAYRPEAKQRVAIAAKEAAIAFPSTGGHPGPDYGKTEDEILEQIIREKGYDYESVLSRANENAGGGTRNEKPKAPTKPSAGKPAAGGFDWNALPKAQ